MDRQMYVTIHIPVTVCGIAAGDLIDDKLAEAFTGHFDQMLNKDDHYGPGTRYCFYGELFRHVLSDSLKAMGLFYGDGRVAFLGFPPPGTEKFGISAKVVSSEEVKPQPAAPKARKAKRNGR